MLAVTREDITEGPLARALVVLALPLIAQNLVQIANQVVDVFWLGRLSENAVAGVGLVIPLLGIAFSLLFVATVGTQVVVAQRVGEGDELGFRRAALNGLWLSIAIGIAAGAATAALAPSLVAALDPGPAVVGFAVPYLTVYALGFPVLFAADGLEAGLVGVGDTRAAFLLNGLAVGLNILLDPVLIFGLFGAPALGVRGAALASVLGYTGGLLLGLGLLWAGRQGLRLTRAAAGLDAATMREIADVGLPNAGQTLGQQGARLAVVAVVASVAGPAGLAAYTVGARIATVAVIPALGLQQAAQSVVGQNLGASFPDRARRATWIGVGIAVGGLTVLGVAQWLAPGVLVDLFVPGASPVAAALTVDYLRILAYGYPAIGAVYLFYGGFNGARRTRTSMVATLLQYWAVRVPLAAVGAIWLGFGVHAAFWAVTVSNVAAAVGAGWYYRWAARDGMLGRAAAEATE
ncbi:MAG: MATE family efflux transporter [Halobacteriales archaeon]|nr:MATE family efflux transporter [Halobacteriales archaeon]